MSNNQKGGHPRPDNYTFIPIKTQPAFYECSDADKINSGYMDITLTTVSDLHIGNGKYGKVGGKLVKCFEKSGGRYIVPGSSLKGCIRNIARIVSDGCVPVSKFDDSKLYVKNIKCGRVDRCIVCDIFGVMGKRSSVFFDDLIAREDTKAKITGVSQPREPKKYISGGKFKGYKLYPTECEDFDDDRDLMIEAVAEDTEFTGRVYFERLSKDELCLLMFAMGLDETFDLKLGGFKFDDMGECYIVCDKLMINGKEADAAALADEYTKGYGKDFESGINKLRNILRPV